MKTIEETLVSRVGWWPVLFCAPSPWVCRCVSQGLRWTVSVAGWSLGLQSVLAGDLVLEGPSVLTAPQYARLRSSRVSDRIGLRTSFCPRAAFAPAMYPHRQSPLVGHKTSDQ